MTIFEKSVTGRTGYTLPEEKKDEIRPSDYIPEHLLRKELPGLPECSEIDVVRHYTELTRKNYSVDNGFYPLGSCTMKYNPKLNEKIAALEGFSLLHPYEPIEKVQGALEVMYRLQTLLSEITGMDAFTLQPAAGAHGELTGMLMVKKYFEVKGENQRTKVIVPDSAHGTNPASASMAGFQVVEIKSNDNGIIDLDNLEAALDESVAAIMLTNPNTLGLFEKDIIKIAEMAHKNGTLLYYDGANLNAIMGKVRPGDMGFDIVHLNLHKTFSTPHGMGGPGSGPVGVKGHLKEFLPIPVVDLTDEGYILKTDLSHSIGRIRSFYGNFGVVVKALAYILMLGKDGLTYASEIAVLNANYLRTRLSELIPTAYPGLCKHEFVLDGTKLVKEYGIKTLDLAKRMLDYGVHPPTIYFPLIVHEALMIEPTETENKDNLDHFVEVVKKILEEAKKDPEFVKNAPYNTPIKRLDEVTASRKPKVRWIPKEQ
ncbi:aminomethyl-transferring glycine dehydrogenase subunit GcvPB [Kosmotoga sp. DU53]|uniref:aminomethyl-transferring glycine dehydrogenase subunit GcvPB n=1 Tax=Kosmotoga sp. DU53 TaxID=1310160 RepID=UPI0007C59753|nr:aminomethyl-transferring glycine dehydrogenase subunit GcvPB [Kosmotoga sp. DU53]OAA20241.1 glycine dehydrogenase [Kosmotoga sp. DU53]